MLKSVVFVMENPDDNENSMSSSSNSVFIMKKSIVMMLLRVVLLVPVTNGRTTEGRPHTGDGRRNTVDSVSSYVIDCD